MGMTGHSHNINVHNFSNSVLKTLNEQRNRGQFCDVTIRIHGSMLRAHRCVLAAGSPFFQDKLLLGYSDIEIPSVVSVQSIQKLIDFMYSGLLHVSQADALQILTAASILQIKTAIDECTRIVSLTVGSGGVVGVPVNLRNSGQETHWGTPESAISSPSSDTEFVSMQLSLQQPLEHFSSPNISLISPTDSYDCVLGKQNDAKDPNSMKLEPSDKYQPTPETTHCRKQSRPVRIQIGHGDVTHAQEAYACQSYGCEKLECPEDAVEDQSCCKMNSFDPGLGLSFSMENSLEAHHHMKEFDHSGCEDCQQEVSSEILLANSEDKELLPKQMDIEKEFGQPQHEVRVSVFNEARDFQPPKNHAQSYLQHSFVSHTAKIKMPFNSGGNCQNNTAASHSLPSLFAPKSNFSEKPIMFNLPQSQGRQQSQLFAVPQSNMPLLPSKLFGVCSSTQKNLNHSSGSTGMDEKRPYKCALCSKTFTAKQNYVKHMFVHTGEKPHQCNICWRSFSLKDYLIKHMVTHTGIRAYQCGICNKRFTQKSSLNVHMRLHHKEKSFECFLCKKKFSHETLLGRHMALHSTCGNKAADFSTDKAGEPLATLCAGEAGSRVVAPTVPLNGGAEADDGGGPCMEADEVASKWT